MDYRNARKELGWRIETLSRFSGISAAEISRIESGRLKATPRPVEKLTAAIKDVTGWRIPSEVLPSNGGRSISSQPGSSWTQELQRTMKPGYSVSPRNSETYWKNSIG